MSFNPPPPFDLSNPEDIQGWQNMINSIVSFVSASTYLASTLRNTRRYFPDSVQIHVSNKAKFSEIFDPEDFPWFLDELNKIQESANTQSLLRNFHKEVPLIKFPLGDISNGGPSTEPRAIRLIDTEDFGVAGIISSSDYISSQCDSTVKVCKKVKDFKKEPSSQSCFFNEYSDSEQTIDSLNCQEYYEKVADDFDLSKMPVLSKAKAKMTFSSSVPKCEPFREHYSIRAIKTSSNLNIEKNKRGEELILECNVLEEFTSPIKYKLKADNKEESVEAKVNSTNRLSADNKENKDVSLENSGQEHKGSIPRFNFNKNESLKIIGTSKSIDELLGNGSFSNKGEDASRFKITYSNNQYSDIEKDIEDLTFDDKLLTEQKDPIKTKKSDISKLLATKDQKLRPKSQNVPTKKNTNQSDLKKPYQKTAQNITGPKNKLLQKPCQPQTKSNCPIDFVTKNIVNLVNMQSSKTKEKEKRSAQVTPSKYSRPSTPTNPVLSIVTDQLKHLMSRQVPASSKSPSFNLPPPKRNVPAHNSTNTMKPPTTSNKPVTGKPFSKERQVVTKPTKLPQVKSCLKSASIKNSSTPKTCMIKIDSTSCCATRSPTATRRQTTNSGLFLGQIPKLHLIKDTTLKLSAAQTIKKASEMLKMADEKILRPVTAVKARAKAGKK